MRLLILLLLAAPLSAQQTQTTLVPDVNVNLPPMEITNEITVMSDEERLERIAVALEGLVEAIANQECNTCGAGASTTAKIGLGVAVPLLLWIAISLNKSANKTDVHEVNIPPRERKNQESEH